MKKIKLRQPTQKEIIQNHLMHNKKITSLECILKYNIIDLQGVIRDLKNEGLDIYSRWVKNSTTHKSYKEYSLTPFTGE